MATKKNASLKSQDLTPPDGGLAVRMYRHGLGDCFLLAFARTPPAKPCYVLIDCGVHMRQKNGATRLGEVMKDVAEVTGGNIDIVVATHEHADHLSGFVQTDGPFAQGKVEVDRFWAAWTEKLDDGQAKRLRARRGAARKVIQAAVKKLKERSDTGLAECLTGLMDFETMPAAAPTTAGAAKTAKASSNEVALELLRQRAHNVEYCEPGAVLKLPGVTEARAYVLGPPRDEVLLKRDTPRKGPGKETYLTARAQQQTFLVAPPFGETLTAEELDRDFRHPFESAVRRKYHFANGPTPRWGRDGLVSKGTRSFCNAHYFKADSLWRRIDTDWLGAAEQLALDLDSDTNNTSLVLAFEVGPVGQGDVLLFVGDAQVGNWLSWRSQRYRVGARTCSADDLLARTVLYKVGHHGSHNATIRRDPLHSSPQNPQGEPFGLELMPSRLIAMIPVDQDAVRKPMPKPWLMPHVPLYRRLLERADGRVLRSDGRPPSDVGVQLEAHSPGTTLARVPGLANVQWRESDAVFKAGSDPLYYDIVFKP